MPQVARRALLFAPLASPALAQRFPDRSIRVLLP